MKKKIISIRIDEDTFNQLQKSKIDISGVVRKELEKIAGIAHCPTCGNRVIFTRQKAV